LRVAVVDIGTNSTRLLIAEVRGGRLVEELARRTEITRLGEGVDATGRLAEAATERVLATCARYRAEIDSLDAERVVAVLTSAVRDARNGEQFRHELRRRFGFDANTISGEREARLTYHGATSWRAHDEPLLVLDIGGGSTELVVGAGDVVEFHASTQIGSVRFTERWLAQDPPPPDALAACRTAVRAGLEQSVPEPLRLRPRDGVAVAGTPTSFAAIELELEPYDRERVHGHRLGRDSCEQIIARLAALPLAERRQVRGLHPERAPTIVAGGLILVETMVLFGLDAIEVSERDILEGAALEQESRAEMDIQANPIRPKTRKILKRSVKRPL
jgi:exopolyphosphatase/guanosine-5'-triphosphate,3'-diphosphate pyrophosphatase